MIAGTRCVVCGQPVQWWCGSVVTHFGDLGPQVAHGDCALERGSYEYRKAYVVALQAQALGCVTRAEGAGR